jgi:hypothetical protein
MTLLNSKQCLRVVATVVLSFQAEQYFKVVEFQAGQYSVKVVEFAHLKLQRAEHSGLKVS